MRGVYGAGEADDDVETTDRMKSPNQTDPDPLTNLRAELKTLIVEQCDVDIEAPEIDDDERLLGGDTRLGLDSLDALTIALAVKDRYGKHIDSGNETRRALTSVRHLAVFIGEDRILDATG